MVKLSFYTLGNNYLKNVRLYPTRVGVEEVGDHGNRSGSHGTATKVHISAKMLVSGSPLFPTEASLGAQFKCSQLTRAWSHY